MIIILCTLLEKFEALCEIMPSYFTLMFFLTGMFGDIEIGRANANDPDDWDYVDKHYTMINPNGMDKFFK